MKRYMNKSLNLLYSHVKHCLSILSFFEKLSCKRWLHFLKNNEQLDTQLILFQIFLQAIVSIRLLNHSIVTIQDQITFHIIDDQTLQIKIWCRKYSILRFWFRKLKKSLFIDRIFKNLLSFFNLSLNH